MILLPKISDAFISKNGFVVIGINPELHQNNYSLEKTLGQSAVLTLIVKKKTYEIPVIISAAEFSKPGSKYFFSLSPNHFWALNEVVGGILEIKEKTIKKGFWEWLFGSFK